MRIKHLGSTLALGTLLVFGALWLPSMPPAQPDQGQTQIQKP